MLQDRLRDRNRLRVLDELSILDTPPEPAYDQIARLAATCCQSTVAAVNFVAADRHWTKAVVGAQGQLGASVAEHISFCAATVRAERAVLVIPDTSVSERWRSSPQLAQAPGVRFYAGATIVVAREPVGVVSVSDDRPRQLDEAALDALVMLAAQVSAHLELRRHNAVLRTLAVTDPLTGLANRTLLIDRLNLAIAERRRTGRQLGILFCDIDGFKQINDRLGHDAGDRILSRVATALLAASRATDTVARLSGDEFVVICSGLAGSADLDAAAARVTRRLALTNAHEGAMTPRVSIGTALHEPDETADSLLRRADQAMYLAKAARRR